MRILLLIPVLLGLLVTATVSASPPTIQNPTEPPVVETWRLREVWRLDNDKNEDLPLMGTVTQAVVDQKGHVLLLDSQMAHILEIGPGGRFLGTLSRMGQGPGELENPNSLFLTADGLLGLVQVFPGKVVLINRDDTPGGSISAQGENPMFFRVEEAAGNLVIAGKTMSFAGGDGQSTEQHFIGRYSRDGTRLDAYHEATTATSHDPPAMNEKGSWFPTRQWAQAADGSVLIATQREVYRLEWLETDGELRRVITRNLNPHVRTKAERKRVLDSMRMWGSDGEIELKKTILDTAPAIDRVKILDDGRIWVRSCYAERGLPDDVHCRYDVHDSEGHLEAEVRIGHPVDRDRDYFSLLSDGRFLWLRNMRSALNARFAAVESHDTDADGAELAEEDFVIQVVLLERAVAE